MTRLRYEVGSERSCTKLPKRQVPVEARYAFCVPRGNNKALFCESTEEEKVAQANTGSDSTLKASAWEVTPFDCQGQAKPLYRDGFSLKSVCVAERDGTRLPVTLYYRPICRFQTTGIGLSGPQFAQFIQSAVGLRFDLRRHKEILGCEQRNPEPTRGSPNLFR